MRFGKIDLKETDWNKVETACKNIETDFGKKKVDPSKDETFWYEREEIREEPSSDRYISSVQIITHIKRMKDQIVDKLTSKVFDYFSYDEKEIALTLVMGEKNVENISLLVQQGTGVAISQLSKLLNIDMTMRKKVSLSPEFIEFLNITERSDNNYRKIFKNDIESKGRKSKSDLNHHSLIEYYENLDRDVIKKSDNKTEETFDNMAVLKITPQTLYATFIPTIEVKVYKDWIDVTQPKKGDPGVSYYNAILYSYNRIEGAFKAFESL
ncbi:MAG: hypothetical protein ACYDAO_05150 [Thermoplasmataceae archaeon]